MKHCEWHFMTQQPRCNEPVFIHIDFGAVTHGLCLNHAKRVKEVAIQVERTSTGQRVLESLRKVS